LEFPYFGPFEEEELSCNQERVPFFRIGKDNRAFAFIAHSYFAKEEFSCVFSFTSKSTTLPKRSHVIKGLQFAPLDYPKETLQVKKKRVVLSPKNQARVEQESIMLEKIFSNSHDNILFEMPFKAPLASKVTSAYGTQRVLNNIKQTQHLGIDFRAALETPIQAANAGRVVFAGNLFFDGNAVIIDHGVKVFSIYSHLSKILVKVGDMVTQQTVVGLSGRSGRANGPHLHWGCKIQGHYVNGFSLVEASKLVQVEEPQKVKANSEVGQK
jgi:murein DD-endopeptidase MepM/ murein hydrolase activator NlpD